MRAVNLRNVIVCRKSLVDDGVVRVNKVHDAVVVFEDFIKEGNWLFQHRFLQGFVGDMSHAVHSV